MLATTPQDLLRKALILSVQLYLAVTVYATRPDVVCQDLGQTLGEDSIGPYDVGYESLRTKNWVQTAWGMPECIFQPRSKEELRDGTAIIIGHNTSFAVRSGGHSPHHGFANIDGGILIDMGNFNRLIYSPEDETTIVGSGLSWSDVYSYLEQYQTVVVGGRILDVGVGGLILGGGLSWLTDLYGLACDNVVNFEVLLANGTFVNANVLENNNLYKALKGGTNNFGIVTEFTLRNYPLGQIWGGIKTYTIQDLPAIMKAYYEYQSTPEKDPYANAIILASPTNSTVGVWVSMIYLNPEPNPQAFSPFYDIPTTSDSTGIKSFMDYLAEYAIPMDVRADWRTVSFEVDSALYTDIADIILNSPAVDTMKSVQGGFLAATIQPISSRVAALGQEHGTNILGLQQVDQTWFSFSTSWLWEDDDSKVHVAEEYATNQVLAAAKRNGKDLRYLFMNDASWDQDVVASYGTENVQLTKEVQRQYDPQLVFQRLVRGGFKLP
ncbi:putative FAD-binding oxidoreductase [Xylariaceae sp. FL1019]|nr:putative FAD-binding oxidoreductase [Xylariaceae sp. FL1019]